MRYSLSTHVLVLAVASFVFGLLGISLSAQAAESEADSSDLTGLWGSVRVFPKATDVRLSLYKDGSGYLARSADETVRVAGLIEGRLELRFPLGTGSFVGVPSKGGREFVGHWITEPSTFIYSHYAAPMTLTSDGKNRWFGQIDAFEQRFSIYIDIRADKNPKGLRAYLRNPERNQGVNTRLHSVTQVGSEVLFSNPDGEPVLTGRLDEPGEVLSITLPSRGGTYDLRRLARAEAGGFYPRRTTQAYSYRAPRAKPDGWRVGHAIDTGIDPAGLQKLVQSIVATSPESLRTPYIHSLLVARRGKLVLEEYFHGYNADRLHDLRSATKSVTGLMAGVASDEQKDFGPDTLVYPLFDFATSADARREALTVRHLLTMNSGFDCDDNNSDTPGNEDRMQSQDEQPDWWRYTLELPMAQAPGEKAFYCSAGINLLGGAISKATGEWLPDFFHSRFAEPLQIDHYQLNLDPLQRGYAGGGMHMRPRDFLKFGQLLLDDGKWRGKRVVPAAWVQQSIDAHSSINEEADYGFTWWLGTLPYQGRQVRVASATGNGGQLLIVVPELELVVGFTGGNYGDFRTWLKWREQLVPEGLFSALSD